ncbi:MAG: group II intron reverse transcriptase/maturase [Proteobacteria bacterium]|nr:group II intron reverse transcriptase/maturase [Pseudomonadota bacterium]
MTGRNSSASGKPFPITKRMVWEAYLEVRGKGKAAGVDRQSLEDFDEDRENNLYRLWNRMASGSYFPPPVKRVEIPKGGGGTRSLGIPTVTDRIAQMVVKKWLEPDLDGHFDPDSYGYRPGKSAHDAVGQARERCWRRDWVVDLDIKAFFDSIDHGLMMKALHQHTQEKWVLLYVQRWLEAPVQLPDGRREERRVGTPQGGVISPLLANLFLHYVFDRWMRTHHPGVQFERYADDAICHCTSRRGAERLKEELEERFWACGLVLHPEKTRIVYCKDSRRRGSYPDIQFTFLGFCFRPRAAADRKGERFTSFLPGVSPRALKKMRERIRSWRLGDHAPLPLEDVTRFINPILRGWWQYYGRYYPSAMYRLFRYLDERLGSYLRRKYRDLWNHTGRSLRRLNQIATQNPEWLVHWQKFGRAMVG